MIEEFEDVTVKSESTSRMTFKPPSHAYWFWMAFSLFCGAGFAALVIYFAYKVLDAIVGGH